MFQAQGQTEHSIQLASGHIALGHSPKLPIPSTERPMFC